MGFFNSLLNVLSQALATDDEEEKKPAAKKTEKPAPKDPEQPATEEDDVKARAEKCLDDITERLNGDDEATALAKEAFQEFFGVQSDDDDYFEMEGIDTSEYDNAYIEEAKERIKATGVRLKFKDGVTTIYGEGYLADFVEEEDELFCEQLYKIAKKTKKLVFKSNFDDVFSDDVLFYKFDRAEEIVLPEGLEEIPYGAFTDYERLKKIVLPQSLTHIGEQAFEGCKKLQDINMRSDIRLADHVFYNTPLKTLQQEMMLEAADLKMTFSDGTMTISGDGSMKKFCDIMDWYDNPEYYSDRRNKTRRLVFESPVDDMFDILSSYNRQFPHLEEVVLPEGVDVISSSTFSDCKKLKKAVLPGSLKEIEDHAFRGCARLEDINLSEGVKLGYRVFYGTPLQDKYE